MQQSIDSNKFEKQYYPSQGFQIHFDWVIHFPLKYKASRITYGLFKKGQIVVKPTLLSDHYCNPYDYRSNISLISEHKTLYDVAANRDTIMVFELQGVYLDEDGVKQIDVYGWSLLEIFDVGDKLIRGRFKVPLYKTSINPSQLVSNDVPLRSVSDTLVFIRISFPYQDEYGKSDYLYPDLLQKEYFLSGIHTKTIIRHDFEHKKQDLKMKGMSLAFDDLFSHLEPEEAPRIQDVQDIIEEQRIEEYKLIELGNFRKGLYVNIHELLNFTNPYMTKLRCFLTDVKRGVIKDEKQIPCSFETDPYEVSQSTLKNAIDPILAAPFVYIEEDY